MGLFNKKLNAALSSMSVNAFSGIAVSCREQAERMREAAGLLDEAGKAYDAGDPVKGHDLLQKSEDCFAKK